MNVVFVEIQQLLGRQSHAIDSGAAAEWAGTFTDDGVFRSPTYPAPVRGRAELTEFAAKFVAANPTTRHVVTNLWLEDDATDQRCHARATLMIVRTDSDSDTVHIDRVTTIRDRLVRVDGTWRIAERVVTRDGHHSAPRKEQH